MRAKRFFPWWLVFAAPLACVQLLGLEEDVPYAPVAEAGEPDTSTGADAGIDVVDAAPPQYEFPNCANAPPEKVVLCIDDWTNLDAARAPDSFVEELDASDPDVADGSIVTDWYYDFAPGCTGDASTIDGASRLDLVYDPEGAPDFEEFPFIVCTYETPIYGFTPNQGFRLRVRFDQDVNDAIESTTFLLAASRELLYLAFRHGEMAIVVREVTVARVPFGPGPVDLQLSVGPGGQPIELFVNGRWFPVPPGIGFDRALDSELYVALGPSYPIYVETWTGQSPYARGFFKDLVLLRY